MCGGRHSQEGTHSAGRQAGGRFVMWQGGREGREGKGREQANDAAAAERSTHTSVSTHHPAPASHHVCVLRGDNEGVDALAAIGLGHRLAQPVQLGINGRCGGGGCRGGGGCGGRGRHGGHLGPAPTGWRAPGGLQALGRGLVGEQGVPVAGQAQSEVVCSLQAPHAGQPHTPCGQGLGAGPGCGRGRRPRGAGRGSEGRHCWRSRPPTLIEAKGSRGCWQCRS
jgi:hypothetical protein